MTIAVNTRFLLKDRLEGIGWFTYETVRRLVNRHPEHQFLFFFDRPYDEQFVFAKNVRPIVLLPPARHPFLFYIWFEFAVHNALKKYKADLFISPDGFLSLKTKVPTLLVIHDLAHVHFTNQVKFWEQKYYNYFMPKFARRAHRIATVSEYSKQDIHQQYQIPLEKIDVVFNGVRPVFKPLGETEKTSIKAKYSDGQDYLFYIGAIHPRKNIHQLILAFDQYKKATHLPIKLLIAGRFAWHTGIIKESYEGAVYNKDIRFLDYIPNEEVPRLMAAALAFVYISRFEGFGIPLLEAMHCEVPIITSNVTSMPEVAGTGAILVNPEATEEIKNAMIELTENPVLRASLIEKGREQRTRFSWDLTTKKFEESIEKIITGKI